MKNNEFTQNISYLFVLKIMVNIGFVMKGGGVLSANNNTIIKGTQCFIHIKCPLVTDGIG